MSCFESVPYSILLAVHSHSSLGTHMSSIFALLRTFVAGGEEMSPGTEY